MRKTPDDLVCDPEGGSSLSFSPLGDEGDGVLLRENRQSGFPVSGGVPVMLPDAFNAEFLAKYRDLIAGNDTLSSANLAEGSNSDWSFSREWDAHFQSDSDRTWGYTVEERYEQFLMENVVTEKKLKSQRVLDAGCGNGALTLRIASACNEIVGLDFSSSVQYAERMRKAPNAYFVQGDLLSPPLPEESFDIVFSIGVLHHTPDTRAAFDAVARLVKPGGKFYVWLYRRPERFLGRNIKVPIYDAMRFVTSRLPARTQNGIVYSYAWLVHGIHNLRRSGNSIPLREYVVSAYDDLTCRWRYYHTPIEVARWYHEAGFSAPTLSHWDNPYGFGLVAERKPQSKTPGISYGGGAKLWDNSQTLLGRLHKD